MRSLPNMMVFDSATVSEAVNVAKVMLNTSAPCFLRLNKKGVEYALRVCHALHMEIDSTLWFDRKNYYYSDLPKGFQITQDKRPIGRNGYIDVVVDGEPKRIEIERLHMEEDTAKQVHYSNFTLIDYNRAGIPLIEIVTKPTIRSGKAGGASGVRDRCQRHPLRCLQRPAPHHNRANR